MADDLLVQTRAFHHPSDFPQGVRNALAQNEAHANTILPFARTAAGSPREGDKQLWVALHNKSNDVLFVLSCTKGPMGDYPIYILDCRSSASPQSQEGHTIDTADAMSALIRRLLENSPPERVFSVFSTGNVSRAFAKVFEEQVHPEHGIRVIDEPYYRAVLASCRRATLVEEQDFAFPSCDGEEITIALRRADASHLEGVTRLCKGFSEDSPPYKLDDKGAELEARTMIENKQVWVHLIKRGSQEPEIACLVATTRESDTVTTVTKVFTAPHLRGLGCAVRLLYRVCQDALFIQRKEQVVLYVGTSDKLAPARHLYRKLGFQGLDEEHIQQLSDTEKWLEIGFQPTRLGYW